jgi:hypothetical protein
VCYASFLTLVLHLSAATPFVLQSLFLPVIVWIPCRSHPNCKHILRLCSRCSYGPTTSRFYCRLFIDQILSIIGQEFGIFTDKGPRSHHSFNGMTHFTVTRSRCYRRVSVLRAQCRPSTRFPTPDPRSQPMVHSRSYRTMSILLCVAVQRRTTWLEAPRADVVGGCDLPRQFYSRRPRST